MPVLTPADLEALSAYLDNELDPATRAELERRLAAEPDLRAELDALRAVVAQLHAVPLLRAPRDFRLDPAVVGRRRTMTPLRRAYRWSSAASALAAVIVLALGVAGFLNRSQVAPAASTAQFSAAREAQATEMDLTGGASDAIALAATPLPTPAPFGTAQEASGEADTFAAPPALAPIGADDAAAESSLEGAQNAAGEAAGFAPPAPSPTVAAFGQSADVAAGGVSSPKETPAGQGGGMIAPQPAGQPQTSAVPEVALDAQEEAEAPAAALSVPAGSEVPTDDEALPDNALGQRMVETATPAILAAMVPTATSLPAPTFAPAPPPSVDEASAAAPGAIDPALWFGAGLALLALAGVLYALSRK